MTAQDVHPAAEELAGHAETVAAATQDAGHAAVGRVTAGAERLAQHAREGQEGVERGQGWVKDTANTVGDRGNQACSPQGDCQ